jgi:hypothetical protein
MPGSFLPKRIRTIVESGPVPRISRARMACVAVICTITCAAFASGRLQRFEHRIAPYIPVQSADVPTFSALITENFAGLSVTEL